MTFRSAASWLRLDGTLVYRAISIVLWSALVWAFYGGRYTAHQEDAIGDNTRDIASLQAREATDSAALAALSNAFASAQGADTASQAAMNQRISDLNSLIQTVMRERQSQPWQEPEISQGEGAVPRAPVVPGDNPR